MVPLKTLNAITFVLMAGATLHPMVSSGGALIVGIVYSLIFGTPFLKQVKALSSNVLKVALVGLGGGINLALILKVGLTSQIYIICSITGTFALAALFARIFGLQGKLTTLLAAGTAICGGSAIAAVAPAIDAREEDISTSLTIVFVLNAVALYLFPFIAHQFGMPQENFGLWSALAIHDTSSVVGAAMQFGEEALTIATTVKLARALWILPVAFAIGFLYRAHVMRNNGVHTKPQVSFWFLWGFLAMSLIVSFIPALQPYGDTLSALAKRLLVLSLFLIGACMNRQGLKMLGMRTIGFGIALWFCIASALLLAITYI
jgi:uncharacterized integral membrane protein (TIGR00698 family)